MNLTEQIQKNLDLNQKEAETLLAVIEIGPAAISDIAKRAKIKRPTVYYLIEELIKKSLILKVPFGKRIFYKATEPKKILNLVEQKKQSLEKLIPELEALFLTKPNQPKVRFYEGKEGLRNIYEEMLNTHKNVYNIFSFDDFLTVFSEKENEYFFQILRNAGGQLYNLIKSTPLAIKSIKTSLYRKGITKNKFFPESLKVKTNIIITDNKVAMLSFNSLAGVIIEDQDIADSQREFIKYIWKTVK